jgi:hypothetical protein
MAVHRDHPEREKMTERSSQLLVVRDTQEVSKGCQFFFFQNRIPNDCRIHDVAIKSSNGNFRYSIVQDEYTGGYTNLVSGRPSLAEVSEFRCDWLPGQNRRMEVIPEADGQLEITLILNVTWNGR